jgi:hypothetical protein
MKTLAFARDEKKGKVTVDCADGAVSVYSHCSSCKHCMGVRIGERIVKSPQMQALADMKRGVASDESLMNAAMMFNTLIRDGTAIECDDDGGEGFRDLY